MAYSSPHNIALRHCKNIEDATAYTALHMATCEPKEVAKLMLLARYNTHSNKDFAVRLAEVAPLKEHSISINHSRFDRLKKSSTVNEFVCNFLLCLKAIEYDCSKKSIEAVVDSFFAEDDSRLWNFHLCYEFYTNQPKACQADS